MPLIIGTVLDWLTKTWKRIAVWIAAVALVFAGGFYTGQTYEEGRQAANVTKTVTVSQDSKERAQKAANQVAAKASEDKKVISRIHERQRNEIQENKEAIRNGVDDLGIDWLQHFNASKSNPLATSPARTDRTLP